MILSPDYQGFFCCFTTISSNLYIYITITEVSMNNEVNTDFDELFMEIMTAQHEKQREQPNNKDPAKRTETSHRNTPHQKTRKRGYR